MKSHLSVEKTFRVCKRGVNRELIRYTSREAKVKKVIEKVGEG
jgi:hypothetical protein